MQVFSSGIQLWTDTQWEHYQGLSNTLGILSPQCSLWGFSECKLVGMPHFYFSSTKSSYITLRNVIIIKHYKILYFKIAREKEIWKRKGSCEYIQFVNCFNSSPNYIIKELIWRSSESYYTEISSLNSLRTLSSGFVNIYLFSRHFFSIKSLTQGANSDAESQFAYLYYALKVVLGRHVTEEN